MRRLLLLAAFLLAVWAASSMASPRVQGCAFSVTPTTYEPPRNRAAVLAGLDLAGFNMIAPDDSFFGTPLVETGTRANRRLAYEPYIPPTLLKAIAWIESSMTQADWNTPFGAVGPALISFDCGHGIMQVTSGMTSPADNGWPSRQQALVATHYLYNIARGAAILVSKWNAASEARPVAGTDTEGSPRIVENWYFAVWGYNGFTGPGANRSNHPADPVYAEWPRTGYSCGPLDDGYGHSYANYPYQELVYGCASRPPSVDGHQLWTPPNVPYALPDLSDPRWAGPLSLDNWAACSGGSDCSAMDIPSPLPWHYDQTPRPGDGVADYLLGSPVLVASRNAVSQPENRVAISNAGTGILAWRARPGQSWIGVNKQAGVALGLDVPCAAGAPCDRSPILTITIEDEDVDAPGWVDIESLTTGEVWRISVVAGSMRDVNCDGAVNTIDALFLLQFDAGLMESLPCEQNADVNADGRINSLDAVLILQFDAGLLQTL